MSTRQDRPRLFRDDDILKNYLKLCIFILSENALLWMRHIRSHITSNLKWSSISKPHPSTSTLACKCDLGEGTSHADWETSRHTKEAISQLLTWAQKSKSKGVSASRHWVPVSIAFFFSEPAVLLTFPPRKTHIFVFCLFKFEVLRWSFWCIWSPKMLVIETYAHTW